MIKLNRPALPATLLVSLMLAGCASMETSAPIDEAQSARVTTAKPTATATPTTPVTTAVPAAPSTTGRSETPVGTTAPVTPPVVETRPLPQAAQMPDTGAAKTTAQPAAAPNVTTPGAHKDPASPLAQRVIYFEFDSAVIDTRFQPIIDVHATYLKANPGFKVILQGHADERGSREYNLALGQRRAESVRQALSLLGVPDGQMEAVSFGEEKPAVQGSNEEAWRMNRRTEIHYVGE